MTHLEFITLARKSFVVRAVMVTAENMEAVAEWCGGRVDTVKEEAVVRFFDHSRVPRPMLMTVRVGEWMTAEHDSSAESVPGWVKSVSFKVYKAERLWGIFDVVQETTPVDPDIKKALNQLFFESTDAQHLATTSGDKYGADDIHASVIDRILELFKPKVGLTFEQKRDLARTTARRVISSVGVQNEMATARRIADAILEELYG